MKVLVIGATGQTGRHAVTLLLARGDDVTAFARNPSAVTERSDRLRVVQGDARDPESIDRAMRGQDAVLVAFGPRSLKKNDVQEVLMRHLIGAMTKAGVKRVVNLSAWGSGGAAVPPTNLIARYLFLPVVLRHLLADKRRGEAYLFDSALNYVNVCPAFLKNAPARGGVHASIDGRGLKQYMHREDLAAFMVAQAHRRQVVAEVCSHWLLTRFGGNVMNPIRRASLLIVLAHPDDEIFHGGVLVHLAERGVRVTLACATDGEAGKPHPSVMPGRISPRASTS